MTRILDDFNLLSIEKGNKVKDLHFVEMCSHVKSHAYFCKDIVLALTFLIFQCERKIYIA